MFAINHPIPRGTGQEILPRNNETLSLYDQMPSVWPLLLLSFVPSDYSSKTLGTCESRYQDWKHFAKLYDAGGDTWWETTLSAKQASSCHWVTHKRDPLGHIPPLRYSSIRCIGECQNASGSWLSRLRTSSLPVPFLDYIQKNKKQTRRVNC